MKLFTGNRPFRGNRGWCLVEERPFVYGAPVNDGSLTFQVRIVVLGASRAWSGRRGGSHMLHASLQDDS